MADARVLTVCDAVVRRLASVVHPPESVSQSFAPQYDRKTMTGRYVWVFPASYREAERVSRDTVVWGHKIAVVVAEKYGDAPDPCEAEPAPAEWVRERINWVETYVFDALRNSGLTGGPPAIAPGVWPESVGEVPAYDLDMLTRDKVFWCGLEFEFREARA
jgi:hypothetical protein